jgi:hypothetical protein
MCLQSDISQQVENFSAFRHTLSSLSLWGCHVSSRALITVVNHFPNLVDIGLHTRWMTNPSLPFHDLCAAGSTYDISRITTYRSSIGCQIYDRSLMSWLSTGPTRNPLHTIAFFFVFRVYCARAVRSRCRSLHRERETLEIVS